MKKGLSSVPIILEYIVLAMGIFLIVANIVGMLLGGSMGKLVSGIVAGLIMFGWSFNAIRDDRKKKRTNKTDLGIKE